MEPARVYDSALFVWGAAAATALTADGIHSAVDTAGWPRGLELVYVSAFIVAFAGLLLALAMKARLRKAGVVLSDEGTSDTHLRSMAAATCGVLATQLPYFFRVEVTSAAQAKFTVAAALLTYGAARLWLNRDR